MPGADGEVYRLLALALVPPRGDNEIRAKFVLNLCGEHSCFPDQGGVLSISRFLALLVFSPSTDPAIEPPAQDLRERTRYVRACEIVEGAAVPQWEGRVVTVEENVTSHGTSVAPRTTT
jgi:hypothetical protein